MTSTVPCTPLGTYTRVGSPRTFGLKLPGAMPAYTLSPEVPDDCEAGFVCPRDVGLWPGDPALPGDAWERAEAGRRASASEVDVITRIDSVAPTRTTNASTTQRNEGLRMRWSAMK